LKNDNLSTRVLEDAFEDYTTGSTGFTGGALGSSDYLFERGDVSNDALGRIALSGLGNRIIIDDRIQGCGYYSISIDGAFPFRAGEVDFTRPVIAVRTRGIISEGKVNTKECRDSIENLVNFIPIDESYSLSNHGGTWLFNINADKELEEIGKKLSEKLVGNEKRVGNGPGNTIVLKEAPLVGTLAEICLIDGDKKTIEVKVSSQLLEMNDKIEEGFEKTIVELVTNSMTGSFGKNCFVKNEDKFSCIRLKDLEGLGEGLAIEMKENKLYLSQEKTCVNANIKSNLSEEVTFEINEYEENKVFQNITKITVEDRDTSEIIYSKEFTGSETNKDNEGSILLDNISNTKEKKFLKEVKICAYTEGEASYLRANGVEFAIKAVNKQAGNRKSKEEIITILTDSLHPDDLIKILTTKKSMVGARGNENPYYFTIMWKGDPETIADLAKYRNDLVNLGLMEDALVEGDGGLEATEKGQKVEEAGSKKALGAYMLSCLGASTVCNIGTGLMGTIFNGVADCAIPATIMFRKDVAEVWEPMRGFYDFMGEIPLIGGAFTFEENLPNPTTWIPENADFGDYAYNPATVTGGISGGTQRIMSHISRYAYQGKYGTLNTNIINWGAREAENSFKQGLDSTVRNALQLADDVPLSEAAKNLVDLGSKRYGQEFETAFKKLYKDAIKRKVPIIGKTGTLNAGEIQKMIETAQGTAQARLAQAINKGEITDIGRTPLREILGDREISQIVDDLNPDSELTRAINGYDAVNKLDSVTDDVVRTVPDDLLANIRNDVEVQRILKSQVESSTDEIVRKLDLGLGSTQRRELVESIVDSFGPADYEDIIASGTRMNLVEDGTVLRRVVTAEPDEFKRIISTSLKNKIRAKTASALGDTGLLKLSTGQLDELNQTIANIAGKKGAELDAAVDFTNRSARTKIRQFFSMKALGSVARGVGCGVLSNMAGVYAYNKSIEKTEKEKYEEADVIPEGPLMKGETYKLIVTNKVDGTGIIARINHVDTQKEKEEMEEALTREEEIKGKRLKWDESLNVRRPEDRILREYKLRFDSSKLNDMLKGLSQFGKDDIDSIKKAIANGYSQLLIEKYSGIEGEDRLEKDGFFIPESWVAAIIAVSGYGEADLETEYTTNNEDLKKVKKLSLKLLEETAGGKKEMRELIASNMFEGKERAEKFEILINALDELLRNQN
jgi:hypothetical protein